MKGQSKSLVRPLLPFGLSFLLLAVLLCALSRAMRAGPERAEAAGASGRVGVGCLVDQADVFVCEQTENLAPNPSFEHGAGDPWRPLDWYEDGPCMFSYGDAGLSGDVSARIVGTTQVTNCKLRTRTDGIQVEPGRFYDYSAWVKANLLEGEAYLRIRFWSWQDDPPGWNCEGDAYTGHMTDTGGDWVQVSGSIIAPAGAQVARIEATLEGGSVGSVWFDDVFLGLSTCLDIGKRDYPDPVATGQMLTYTILYSNTGREKATNVQIIETYDEYVDPIVTGTHPPPSLSDNIWEIPELPPGESGAITVVVRVKADSDPPAALFNSVLIRSDETRANPVHTTITTTIDGDGCDIGLYLPELEKQGEPGYATDYDVSLRNAGRHDGQAFLEARSSQGWDVDIVPSPPYTLSARSFKDVTVSPVVPRNAFSGTVDVTTITATLMCGSPSGETVQAIARVTTTVSADVHWVCLPRVTRNCRSVPELYPIDNVDVDGSYTVCWSAACSVNFYVLEEATDSAFTSATEVCSGTDTCCPIEDKSAGRYYYRVKGCKDGTRCGGWSNVEEVGTWWEQEENDSRSDANGPLDSNEEYRGYHDDVNDWFKIDVGAAGSVTMALTDHSGEDVQLVLYDDAGDMVCRDWTAPFSKTCVVDGAGQYYVRIYTLSGHNMDLPYILRVTFP